MGKTVQVICLLSAMFGKSGIASQDAAATQMRIDGFLHRKRVKKALAKSGLAGSDDEDDEAKLNRQNLERFKEWGILENSQSQSQSQTQTLEDAFDVAYAAQLMELAVVQPVLIVVPKTVRDSWRTHLKQWACFSVLVIAEKTDVATAAAAIAAAKDGKYEVVLTQYSMVSAVQRSKETAVH